MGLRHQQGGEERSQMGPRGGQRGTSKLTLWYCTCGCCIKKHFGVCYSRGHYDKSKQKPVKQKMKKGSKR